MHPLQHILGSVDREILRMLKKSPKNTPTFDIYFLPDKNTLVKAVGPSGKEVERTLVRNGFDSGAFFSYAFYNVLHDISESGASATMIWKNRWGRVRKAPYTSRERLFAIQAPSRMITIKIHSPGQTKFQMHQTAHL